MGKKSQEEMKEIIIRIGTGLLEKTSKCDIVIEAAIEKWCGVKYWDGKQEKAFTTTISKQGGTGWILMN